MLKKLMFGFAGLLLIVAFGLNFLMSNINGYIRTAVIKYGSEATKAPVGLDRVRLSLGTGNGSGALENFSVGNPNGFSSNKAIDVKVAAIQVDTNSIRGNGPIIIRSVEIENPHVAYELDNGGNSNLQAIQRNTQDYANSFVSTPTPAKAPEAKVADAPPRKVIIKDFLIRGGNVSISQASLKDRKLETNLPNIHLTNIGEKSNGATVAQVAEQVIGSISNEAAQAAIAELARQKISGALKEVPGGAIGGAAVDNIGTQLKGLMSK